MCRYHDAPDLLFVIAAGNDNNALDPADPTGGDDGGWATGDKSIGSPAVCKNALAVGAAAVGPVAQAGGSVAFFSSRGPTRDGRLKPDVLGPGDAV